MSPNYNQMNLYGFQQPKTNSREIMLRGVKSNACNVLSKSTLHGMSTIFTENFWLIKLFWILCMGLSWGFFIYQASLAVSFYESFPKVTQVSKASEPVIDFPAVDICDLNAYDGQIVKDFIIEVEKNYSIYPNTSSSAKKFVDNANYQIKSLNYYNWTLGRIYVYDKGFWISQILTSCQFQGKVCTKDDFYWYHDFYYGNCFRFNGGLDLPTQKPKSYDQADLNFTAYAIKKSYKPGWRNGLRLELDAGSQSSQIQYAYKTGFRVIVHNQSVLTFPDQDGIDVPIATQTNIGIRRKLVKRLSSPYSNCIDQLTEEVGKQNDILAIMYEKKQANTIKQYQANYCLQICYQVFVVKSCRCYSLSLYSLNLTFYNSTGDLVNGCIEKSEVNCMIAAETEFYNSDAISQCYSSCPNECSVMSYDLKISQAGYSNKWYADFNDENWGSLAILQYLDDCGTTYECIKIHGNSLNIYYESKDYTVIEETPQLTLDYLVGNLGGNLSLFTGMSFLSFVEVLELVLSSLVIVIAYKYS